MHLAYDLLQSAAKLLVVLVIFVPLERIFARRPQKFFRAAFLTDLGYYVLGSVIPKLLLIIPVSLLAAVIHRAMPSPFYHAVGSLPTPLRLCAAMLAGEIGFYWGHRWMHEVPSLWRFHAIHHSAEQMDWLVNTRAHPIDIFIGRFCGLVPMYLLGFAQPFANRADIVPLLFVLIGSLWGFFVHANLGWRLGWFEQLLATPAFHHWHHTNDGPATTDKNYAAMLPWVDRLFGTFHLPKNAFPVAYGIDADMPSGLLDQLAYPLQQSDAAPLKPAATHPVR